MYRTFSWALSGAFTYAWRIISGWEMQSYKKWNKGLKFCMSGAEVASEKEQKSIQHSAVCIQNSAPAALRTAKDAEFAKDLHFIVTALAPFAVNKVDWNAEC
jgi:hypothetical protein